MEEEMRQKIYDMHGTVQSLEEKTESMLRQQGRLDGDISNLEQDLNDISIQANRNQRRIYGVFLLGGVASTAVVVLASGGFNIFA